MVLQFLKSCTGYLQLQHISSYPQYFSFMECYLQVHLNINFMSLLNGCLTTPARRCSRTGFIYRYVFTSNVDESQHCRLYHATAPPMASQPNPADIITLPGSAGGKKQVHACIFKKEDGASCRLQFSSKHQLTKHKSDDCHMLTLC